MPELPEIETVKLQLQKFIIDQRIIRVQSLHKKTLQGDPALVVNKKIVAVSRRGKMLIIDVEGGVDIGIHFKMSGQLILVRTQNSMTKTQSPKEQRVVGGHPTSDWVSPLPSKHTRVIFYFEKGDTMYFNDQRIFGWVKIMNKQDLQALPFLQKLGPEPWDMSDEDFYTMIHKKKKAIKVLLMDQDQLSGVGNIYANDALWEARIHPAKVAHEITRDESKLLKKCVITVLKEGIKYGGATASDAKYVNLDGLGGTYQDHFRVYSREGEPCLRGDGTIQKITLGGRGTFFCPACQGHR